MTYYPTVMARYSLFVLKVPLNPKHSNKQITGAWVDDVPAGCVNPCASVIKRLVSGRRPPGFVLRLPPAAVRRVYKLPSTGVRVGMELIGFYHGPMDFRWKVTVLQLSP